MELRPARRCPNAVDLHLHEALADGSLHYGSVVDGGPFAADALGGSGTIAGVTVRCESAEWSVAWHTGYPPRPVDHHDVPLLCHRYGIALPEGFGTLQTASTPEDNAHRSDTARSIADPATCCRFWSNCEAAACHLRLPLPAAPRRVCRHGRLGRHRYRRVRPHAGGRWGAAVMPSSVSVRVRRGTADRPAGVSRGSRLLCG